MSYLILGGGAVPGQVWQRVAVSFNATATPIAAGAGTVLWTPPAVGYVRGLTLNDDSASPLVGNGGATTLSVGCEGGVLTFLAAAITLASFGTQLQGWGVGGPSTSGTTDGCADEGVIVAPAGAIPGRAALARTIRGFANAGTITGSLLLRFEFRPFAGGAF